VRVDLETALADAHRATEVKLAVSKSTPPIVGDVNGDGRPFEFALFEAGDCMQLDRALIRYDAGTESFVGTVALSECAMVIRATVTRSSSTPRSAQVTRAASRSDLRLDAENAEPAPH
jgi:hypothetical protein